MLRLETDTGWWLVTHPDHARLAGAFAERWGNDLFLAPEPREHVLRGIGHHDDGWAARDAVPQITRQGKPSAFSTELVGKYSGFEEIDLVDYLAVRDRAVRQIAEEDPYAALLISMHTYSLLNDRSDRSTILPDQLPLFERFLDAQKELQDSWRKQITSNPKLKAESFFTISLPQRFFVSKRFTTATPPCCWAEAMPCSPAILNFAPIQFRSPSQAPVGADPCSSCSM